jgi:hypothetical protein
MVKPPPIKMPPPIPHNHQFTFERQDITTKIGGPPEHTDAIINRIKQLEIPPNLDLRDEVSIHAIKSTDILGLHYAPFTLEQKLPPFDHGVTGLHYYQQLRNIMSKVIRAKIMNDFLIDSLARKQIPRGFKINKKVMAVFPTPRLKLAHYKIIAQAEMDLVLATTEHYESTIPKLEEEFNEYYEEMNTLDPEERRLVILQLLHFKNGLINERTGFLQEKIARDTMARDANEDNNPQQQVARGESNHTAPPLFRNRTANRNRNRDPSPAYRSRDPSMDRRSNFDDPNGEFGGPPARPQRAPRNRTLRGRQY